jgi:hypothetical protein
MKVLKFLVLASVMVALSSVTTRAQSCVGNCGTDTPNGVITSPPIGGPNYSYVSTNGGASHGGFLPSGLATPSNATNGSTATTATFTATAGSLLQFDFNYITSDGSGYPDFGWAALETTGGAPVALIFSAQTTPSGNTVPGTGLPPLAPGVTLTPSSSAIIPGGTTWDQLGSSSGACYLGPGEGCGYTGWIQEDYTIPTAGTYELAFGVSNANDEQYDTGLAYSGVEVNGVPVGTPEPSTLLMLGSALLGLATLSRKFLS